MSDKQPTGVTHEIEPTIQQALGDVSRALKAVPKSDRNTQQNYNFRGIDSIMTAVHPALAAAGVVVTPLVEGVEYSTYSTSKGTAMRVAVVTVRYRFHGPAGDYLDAVVVGEASDTADKATNKALSAAFKYALVQTFTLPTDEPDADAETHERVAAPPKQRNARQDAVKVALDNLDDATKNALKQFWADEGLPMDLTALSDDQCDKAMKLVEQVAGVPF